MKQLKLESFPIDDLWLIREQVANLLAEKLTAEKTKVEDRLKQLRGDFLEPQRYSRIHPKYRNPENPSQSWSGRGRTPLWIKRLRMAGKSNEELRVPRDGLNDPSASSMAGAFDIGQHLEPPRPLVRNDLK
jgi:DNA-binding protein H-NS